ncbi:MAG TPA: hypothetical protein GX510_01310 [Firmicutes bacterium]|nr:hypothetical protein [Candidatus Fermentithermobacillaceae bacterium]
MYWKRAVAGILIAAVCVGLGASAAFAEPSLSGEEVQVPGTPNSEAAATELKRPRARGSLAALAYIAGRSGVPLETLIAQFKGGKSLQQIAEENGVDWAEVGDSFTRNRFDKEKLVPKLEERLARMTESRAKLEEHIARLSERIAELKERVSRVQDNTMRGFAERFVLILERRLSLAQEKLSLLEEAIQLTRGLLEYVKTL